jgi:hypothetical protein
MPMRFGQHSSSKIADNLSASGWSWGYVSAIDSQGRTSGLQTHIPAVKALIGCVDRKAGVKGLLGHLFRPSHGLFFCAPEPAL